MKHSSLIVQQVAPMPKKRVLCPECGHSHTVRINGLETKIIGVRARRITGNQFEYQITAPEATIEADRFYSVGDDLLLTGALSAALGTAAGFIASLVAPNYAPQFIGLGASLGCSLGWGWLCAEHNQRLKKVLPWFVKQRGTWATGKDKTIGGNVELTIDHRYRDGHTEAGRTVNRFGALPVDVDRFNEWCQGVLVGKSLAVPTWTPKAKMFARTEYDLLLDKMRGGNIVVNLGSSKGNTLTGGGRRALARHLVDCGIIPPSPASEKDFLGERLTQAAANNGGNTPLPRPEVRAGGRNG